MQKIDFSSDSLPSHLTGMERFRLWRDMWNEQLGPAEIRHPQDKPFVTTTTALLLGDVRVGRFDTTADYCVRTRKHVAVARDDILVGFYRGAVPQLLSVGNCGLSLDAGAGFAYNLAQPCESRNKGATGWSQVTLPRDVVLKLVPHADERAARLLDPQNAAVRHLRRTIDFLLGSDEVTQSPALARQAETALIDLVALALGARGDAAEAGMARGLRAARLREAISIIEARFAEPSLSTEAVARALGLSRRYLNTLLLESGRTFGERVLELRLQKARAMLSDPRYDATRVSDIALICGFNDVSYFNRCFRARFGAPPLHYRGS